MLFLILELSSLPIVVAHPDERHGNRTDSVLEWCDRHGVGNFWFKRGRKSKLAFYFLIDV